MKIYQVRGSGEFHSMIAVDIPRSVRDEYIQAVFLGRSLRQSWCITEGRPLDSHLGFGDFADFNVLSALPVVFARTLDKCPRVRHYINDAGELLPVLVAGEPAFVINVVRLISAIVREESQLRRLSGGQEITDSPVFSQANVPYTGLFRIKEAWNRIYLSEPEEGGFKRLCDDNGFTGLVFKELPIK